MNTNSGENKISARDRAKMLAMIRSPLFWVGRTIPEKEIIDGEKIELRKTVFRYISKEKPSPDEVGGALALAKKLELKARELEDRLKNEALTRTEAERILDHILGLKRAADELRKRSGGGADIGSAARTASVEDHRRWRDFVRNVK